MCWSPLEQRSAYPPFKRQESAWVSAVVTLPGYPFSRLKSFFLLHEISCSESYALLLNIAIDRIESLAIASCPLEFRAIVMIQGSVKLRFVVPRWMVLDDVGTGVSRRLAQDVKQRHEVPRAYIKLVLISTATQEATQPD